MNNFRLKVLDKRDHTLCVSRAVGSGIGAVHTAEYKEGDRIAINCGNEQGLYWIQLDEALGKHLVYFKEENVSFPIIPESKRVCYSPKAFRGNRHVLYIEKADDSCKKLYRNLALNPYDMHNTKGLFPHATANVETRNEMTFAARNAIDGIFENSSHGEYPYQSWGINCNPEAEIKIDFGRKVEVNQVKITLRADWPHDSYWEKGKISFDDGSSEIIQLSKSALPQSFLFEKKVIQEISLGSLIKANDGSPFPALTQIEVYGVEA